MQSKGLYPVLAKASIYSVVLPKIKIFSRPTNSAISILAPSSVPIVRAPFNINFMFPVPDASIPAVEICSDKSLADFQGRPLVSHMVDIAHKLSSEIIIVVSDDDQKTRLQEIMKGVRVVVDPPSEIKCALAGALTAFEYTILF